MKTMHRREFIIKSAAAGVFLAVNPNLFIARPAADRKIFVFSKHLQWLDYETMAKMARQAGFDGLDITVRPKGHVWPEKVEKDLPKAVEAVRKEGLIAETITTAITDANHPYTEMIIKKAAQLGIRQYRMGWIQYDDTLDMAKNLEKIELQLKELAQMNAQYGIRGDYQNHSGTSFGSVVWDIWHVLKNINSSWLGVRFDIRHAVVEGMHSWPVTFKTIAPYIRSLDIKDFRWQNVPADPVVNTPVAEGMVDFERYTELLKQYNIDGHITMHFEYALGGAEHGDTKLTIKPEVVMQALKKDLKMLKGFLEK